MTERRTSPIGNRRAVTLRGRPELYTDYATDQAMLNTPAKRAWTALLVVGLLAAPFFLGRDLTSLLTTVFIFGIGAIGLNLVTGYAGQVSLGHAFFVGLGAYTAAFVGNEPTGSLRGLGLELWVWLPLAGLVPAVVGFLVAPIAARVRGLYLAILTLGLVFIGDHVFKEARTFTGGPGVGRRAAAPIVGGLDLSRRQEFFGVTFEGADLFYLLCFVLLLVAAVLARNLARSKAGRAFAAVRDRDIAAEVMGVPLTRTKVLAFTISSFYAGVCGGLLAITYGVIEPASFDLLLSVDFLAMILIGGVATISGSLAGAAFVVLLPRLVQTYAHYVPGISRGSTGDGLLTVFQFEGLLFGALIVAFIVLEPRGLYGLWLRVRNYWKAWPFSY
ncbi:branched-chain amino acid ABC transporter permease [Egicoccus halophilus]|uniref:Branched-chain amino acid ABC transporter permease n=1 Tax=Egicoccus halophilus TaxID=1670830 RepID=A0A8J3AE94_9ACTN|nr:branched-chain amino acid ABC transporter permease [Egicoccus halophilus]GGI06021.1 branched-chain amino acid ABC transporter permease [Egicoccus halophilus]